MFVLIGHIQNTDNMIIPGDINEAEYLLNLGKPTTEKRNSMVKINKGVEGDMGLKAKLWIQLFTNYLPLITESEL